MPIKSSFEDRAPKCEINWEKTAKTVGSFALSTLLACCGLAIIGGGCTLLYISVQLLKAGDFAAIALSLVSGIFVGTGSIITYWSFCPFKESPFHRNDGYAPIPEGFITIPYYRHGELFQMLNVKPDSKL